MQTLLWDISLQLYLQLIMPFLNLHTFGIASILDLSQMCFSYFKVFFEHCFKIFFLSKQVFTDVLTLLQIIMLIQQGGFHRGTELLSGHQFLCEVLDLYKKAENSPWSSAVPSKLPSSEIQHTEHGQSHAPPRPHTYTQLITSVFSDVWTAL